MLDGARPRDGAEACLDLTKHGSLAGCKAHIASQDEFAARPTSDAFNLSNGDLAHFAQATQQSTEGTARRATYSRSLLRIVSNMVDVDVR